MQYVNLGSTGLVVSRLALGCMTYGSKQWRAWVLDEPESRPFIQRAWELGINFFDTADMYSLGASEEVLGRALKSLAVRREEVVIATKLFFPMGKSANERGLGRKHIRHAIDASLRRLGVDYVDLYQIHRPDKQTPIEETMEALGEVVRAGKALYLGASSMPAYRFVQMQNAAERNGWPRFVSMQNHYNIIYREEEREMIPCCRETGIAVLPWSPLARGFVMGNRRKITPADATAASAGSPAAKEVPSGTGAKQSYGETQRANTDDYSFKLYYRDEDFAMVEKISSVAKRLGVSNAQVALAWLLQQPGVTAPIVGASKLAHLEDLVKALDLKLGEEDMREFSEAYRPHPVLGFT
ncbi:MAG: aldo/keto reductase [Candidatus Korobacteraceae bacterium]|jgi:aryl-alcohol dehydrogenase (NADP+)